MQQNWENQIFDNIHGGPDVVQPFALQSPPDCKLDLREKKLTDHLT